MSKQEGSFSRIPTAPPEEAENVEQGGVAEAVLYQEDDGVQGELVSYLDYKDQANSYIHYVNDTSLPVAQAQPLPPEPTPAPAAKPPALGARPHPSAGSFGIDGQYQPHASNPTETSTLTHGSQPTATSTLTWQTTPHPRGPNANRPSPPPKSADPASENFDFMRFMKKYGFVVLFLGVAVGVALGVVVGTAGGGDDNGGQNLEPSLLFDLLPHDFVDGVDSPIGFSVSLDGAGTRLCVADKNFVYVYEEEAPKSWVALGSPIAPPNNTDPETTRESSIWIRAPVVCRLSADGKVLAVGWSTFVDNTGYVQAYLLENGEWQTHGRALQGVAPDSCFGTTIDLDRDGGVLAVSSPGNGGSVFVYQFNAGNWETFGTEIVTQVGGMTITSVALSSDGETLGIAGKGGSDGCILEIFRHRVGDWLPMGSCIEGVPDGPAYAVDVAGKEGSIVALSNYFLSEKGNDNLDLDSRVFEFVPESEFSKEVGEWVQLGEPLHQVAEGEKQGYFIALSDDGLTMIMGDPGRGGQNQGHAHIFKYNVASSQWEQLGENVDGKAPGDQFGYAVDISGNGRRFAAGSPFSRALGKRNSHGRVLVYEIP